MHYPAPKPLDGPGGSDYDCLRAVEIWAGRLAST